MLLGKPRIRITQYFYVHLIGMDLRHSESSTGIRHANIRFTTPPASLPPPPLPGMQPTHLSHAAIKLLHTRSQGAQPRSWSTGLGWGSNPAAAACCACCALLFSARSTAHSHLKQACNPCLKFSSPCKQDRAAAAVSFASAA